MSADRRSSANASQPGGARTGASQQPACEQSREWAPRSPPQVATRVRLAANNAYGVKTAPRKPSRREALAEDVASGHTRPGDARNSAEDECWTVSRDGHRTGPSIPPQETEAVARTSTRLGGRLPPPKTRLAPASGTAGPFHRARDHSAANGAAPEPRNAASGDAAIDDGATVAVRRGDSSAANGGARKSFSGEAPGGVEQRASLLGWASRVAGFLLAAAILVATGMFVAFTLMPPATTFCSLF